MVEFFIFINGLRQFAVTCSFKNKKMLYLQTKSVLEGEILGLLEKSGKGFIIA